MAKEFEEFKKELLRDGLITEEGMRLAGIKLMLSELIYDLRHAKKMSQKKLAAAIGVSQPYIARVEGGEENLTLETIVKILTALQVTLDIHPRKRKKNEDIFRIAKAA